MSRHQDSQLSLSQNLLLQNKYVEAEKPIRDAIHLTPNLANAHWYLGISLDGQKRLDEAETELREAARLAPTNASYHAFLAGFLEVKVGKLKEAEAELQEAIRLDPNEDSYKKSLQQLRDKMKNKPH